MPPPVALESDLKRFAVAGADGCRGGWVCATRSPRGGAVEVRCVASARELLEGLPGWSVLAIDIPIGLTDAGPRACDLEARRRLGWPRSSSVFPAPIRPALHARSRARASQITRRCSGRGVGAQAFALWPRIRAIDALVDPRCERVFEVHPELAFVALNGGRRLAHSKHDARGLARRVRLVDRAFGRGCFARARDCVARAQAADDDLLDALACLWSAQRIARGSAVHLPDPAPRDRRGLRMCISF